MVANTSRLLQTRNAEMKPAYDSIVKPGPLEDPKSYCFAYWNFRHEADPVPFPRRFEPIGWTNYQNEMVRHCYEYNVHNLSHYLLHPRVHIPILNKVVAHLAVSDCRRKSKPSMHSLSSAAMWHLFKKQKIWRRNYTH